jgi:multiple sugar transport system permease protein
MQERSRVKFIFVVPGIVWVLIFTIFPLLYSLSISFRHAVLGTDWAFNFPANYVRAFDDYRFWNSLTISVFFLVTSVTLTVLVGLGLALLFNRPIRGQRVFRSLFTMPMFTAPIALGYLGLTIFHEDVGAVNTVLRALGMVDPPHWFSAVWPARIAIVLVDVWQWTPFCFLVLLAGLQSLPDEVYEAATLDTTSSWDIFRYITLPLLAPVIFTVSILRLVESFKMLDLPFGMTSGGPGAATQTLSYYIYQTGLRSNNYGYASAIAYILLIILVLISLSFFNRLRQIYE